MTTEEVWEPGEEDWPRHHRGHMRGRRRPRPPRSGPPPFGRDWWGDPRSGFGPWFGEPRGRRGPRAKRGDVRAAALALLAEEPRNGYQIIQEISERSGGVWQPSPGSVYPALQQLEDEGLAEVQILEGGRRHYTLTAAGLEYVAGHPQEVQAPWEMVAQSVGSGAIELRRLFGEVVMAAIQVARVGNDAQIAQAHQILTRARRKLYQILAGDEAADE